MPNQDVNTTVEEVVTGADQAAADQAAYDAVFFGEKNESNSKTEQNEEADQGHEAGQGEPNGDANDPAAAEANQGEEENPDGSSDKAAESNPESDENPKDVKPAVSKIKWKGQEIEVSEEEKTALAQKGFDYTANMQQIAKFRKTIESAGIDDTVINLLSRAKAGDLSAYAELLQVNGVDPTDLIGIEKDEKVNHTLQKTQNDIVPSEEVAPLIEQIQRNPELQSKMEKAEIELPKSVINRIATDVNALYMTVGEVESGSFERVMPRVNARLATMTDFDREAVLNNPDFFVAVYAEEKDRVFGNVQQEQREPAAEQQNVQPTGKQKPNMAAVGVRKPTQVNPKDVINDAFNASNDDFQKIRQRVLNQR